MSFSNSSDPSGDLPESSTTSRDARLAPAAHRGTRLLPELIGRWHWVALGLILGALCSAYYLSKAQKQYTATSTLLIKQQTSSVMERDQIEEIDMRSQESMNTVAERLRRFDLIERVATREDIRSLDGLVPSPPNWLPSWLSKKPEAGEAVESGSARKVPTAASLASMLSGRLEVKIRRNTRLMDVSVVHPEPRVAKAVADAIADEYLKEMSDARTEGRISSIDLLQKESDEARASLQTARGALAIYARALESHRTLDAKETEMAGLQRRYLPKHPRMMAVTGELNRLKETFIREFEAARQSPSDKTYWDSVNSQLPDPETEPDQFVRTARQQLLARIGVLESEIESSTAVFNSMLTRIEESSVNQKVNESLAEVSNLARLPGSPSGPIAKDAYGLGIFGGLAGGFLLALLFIKLDNKFHTVAQVAGETGATVLAAISDIKPEHLAIAQRKYLSRHPEEAHDLHAEWNSRLVFRPGTSNTSYAEMFRVLRASISLLGDERKRKITLFSSALPGEGKTSTSSNFSLAAACQGRKTLLIDLDLRKPSVHKFFGMPREPEQGGITECLANMATCDQVVLRETGQENLHLILSGRRAPNPGELLDTGRLQSILAWACEHYDVVVLDTAPLLAVPDTRIVAPLADNVCLVVRAEYVPKGAVQRVLDIMDEDGTAISGIIFNGFKERRRLIGENYSYGYYKTSKYGSSYRYGYGSYGAYGEDDEESPPKRRNAKRN